MARISTRRLEQLCRRVGQSLRAGLDMRKIWEREATHGSPVYRGRMQFISQRVASGGGLAEAMSSSGGYFPPFVCAMVNVGEHTGRLDDTFLKLADHYEQTLRLRRTFLMGIAWPALELALALIGVPLLVWFVTMLFNIETDVLGLGITGTRGLVLYFLGLALVVGLLTGAAMLLKRAWGLGTVAKYIVHVPVLGACMRLISLSRLAWSLSLANQAGMDIRNAMRLALQSTQNGWLVSQSEDIDRRLLAGEEVHATLRATRQYPEEFLVALETGEVTGQIAESMAHVAANYQERIKSLSHVLTLIGSLLIWGAVGVIIIIMIFRAFMSYLNVLNQAGAPL